MVNQEQMFTVIFSILTNVALYYYGEYRTLKKKLDDKESLHVKTEILEIKAQLNVVANDDELVKKEFLFSHIRDLERKIYEIKDHVFGKGCF